MNPTVALWYTRKKDVRVTGKPPNLEVHVNLWRHNPGKQDFNLLDIGIRILDPNVLGKLVLFVPIPADKCHIHDLGAKLQDEPTLGAVTCH